MESGYKIESILLLKCNFERIPNVTFKDSSSNINIEVNCNVQGNKVFVSEVLNFDITFNGEKEVTAIIEMMGVFEKIGEDLPISPEDFGKINGAAILYPYIREQLSSIAQKAGLGQVILPTANFIKLHDDKI